MSEEDEWKKIIASGRYLHRKERDKATRAEIMERLTAIRAEIAARKVRGEQIAKQHAAIQRRDRTAK